MLLLLAIEAYHGLYRLLFCLYLAHNAVFRFPHFIHPLPPAGYSPCRERKWVMTLAVVANCPSEGSTPQCDVDKGAKRRRGYDNTFAKSILQYNYNTITT